MKKTFSYAFSGGQIVSLWCETTLSLYHTSLTLSYRWSVYRMENKNPCIKQSFCCNCHNFVRFILMKNTTWSWMFFLKNNSIFKVSSPQGLPKSIKTNKTNICCCFYFVSLHFKIECIAFKQKIQKLLSPWGCYANCLIPNSFSAIHLHE